ncbi:MAG: acyl carrier protein [Deltaproteobacteria bacterium]|nr:MAG: acyl carrier protein [Deltaproteobacteria bacterium]
MDAAEITEKLTALIREVVGEDFAEEVSIGPETSFSEDLELESIEFVQLAELMQREWGDRVDFVGWISEKEIDEIIGLTVGDVVEFIATCHS